MPRRLWERIRDDLVEQTEALAVGDVRDFSNFTSAVIDQRAFTKHRDAIARAQDSTETEIVAGGQTDDREGWFVRPTVIRSDNPRNEVLTTEYFGPILGVHVYDDGGFDQILAEVDAATPYGLTGAVLAEDRAALAQAIGGAAVQPPATSTSTTSRPARWWANSRSAAPGPPAPTTRPAPCGT